MGQEHSSGAPATEAVARDAVKILNDSDWAHTVKPSLQDIPCTYQHPAFPGLFPADQAAAIDAIDTTARTAPPETVRPDDSEYLIRFQSAKPVQTAIQELVAMGGDWAAYGKKKIPVRREDGPTDVANLWYNVADMITVAVILKQAGADGTSMFSYGYSDNRSVFPSRTFRVWPCAGLRTSDGQVWARLMPEAVRQDGKTKVLQLSFPRLIDGKPVISKPHDKVEFRLVVNQRVLETTFYINADDVLDGSEEALYLPWAFTDAKQVALK